MVLLYTKVFISILDYMLAIIINIIGVFFIIIVELFFPPGGLSPSHDNIDLPLNCLEDN